MHFHFVTLFPEMIRAYTDVSILGRAQKNKKIKIDVYNPRDYSRDAHKKVDDRPYGGGPGMVLEPESLLRATEKAMGRKKDVKILMMSPRGKTFTQTYAQSLSKKYKHVVFISGRYEGIDARVKKILKAEEVSVGDYVLTGGELPSLTIADAVARQVPGVLGKHESLEDKRTASGEMYTRPEVFLWKGKKYKVPKVLLGGNHKDIEEWRAGRG